MDPVSKRQLALSLFIALQACKLYDWFIDLPSSLSAAGSDPLDDLLAFFFKWAALDLGFLAALHWARVPKLKWRLGIRALIWGGLCCMTLVLAFLGPVLSVVGSSEISQRDTLARESASNIMGEFTVKVRPWAIAKLNQESIRLCLATSSPPPHSHGLSDASKRPLISDTEPITMIPLSLSGTGPWTVVWEFGSLSKGGVFQFNERHTDVFTSSNSFISATRIGYYRLVSVIDGNGSAGKLGKDEKPVLIDSCPEARFDGLAIGGGIESCLGKHQHPFKVWLSGNGGPFDLVLTHFSGQSSKSIQYSGLRPDSTLIEGLNKIDRFQLVTLDPIDFSTVGEHLIRIESIKDLSTGLSKRYGEWDMGDSVLVTVLEAPTVSWSSNQTPFLLSGDKQSSASIGLQLKGRPPFLVKYSAHDLEDSSKLLGSFETVHQEGNATIEVNRPGIYRLLSVSDSLCEGSVGALNELGVNLITPPSIKADFRPIKSPCHGDLGGIFEVELVNGQAPWSLTILESHGTSKGKKNVIRAPEGKRLTHKWIPDTPGTYSIEFLRVADSYYPDGISIGEAVNPVTLSILPMPDVQIISTREFYTCLSAEDDKPLSVVVRLTGLGPWKLDGKVAHYSSDMFTWSVPAASETFTLDLPRPKQAGKHFFKLLTITDGQGCPKTIEGQSVQITTFASAPTASFVEGKTELKVRQDSAQTIIPLALTGNKGPWKIGVKWTSPAGKSSTQYYIVDVPSKGLPVTKDGIYEIVSVRDQYCEGTIGKDRLASISSHPIPRVTFSPGNQPASCRAPVPDLSLSVSSGTGKIVVKYREQFGHDLKECGTKKPTEKQLELQDGESVVKIPMASSMIPGFYRYTLVSISDSIYSNISLEKDNTFTLQVYPDPVPRITNESTLIHCRNKSMSDARLQIDFAGSSALKSTASPWAVTYELLNDRHEIISLNTVKVKSGQLEIADIKEAGSYHVRLTKVVSAHGCVWEAPSDRMTVDQAVTNGHALPLHVIMTPTIKRVENDHSHGCVGDIVKFQLGGTGPWTVTYTLTKMDGTKVYRTETVKAPLFTVLLSEPGSIQITSVSNARCRLDKPDDAHLDIKPLPSAVIEPGNQWVHEDEIASFKVRLGGEAPFSFTYQRLDETTKGVVLDSHTIEGVRDHEYTVEVPGVSGTFRIESVQDKWCRFPRNK